MPHLPSLSVLRSFEAAARYQSFTRAAQDLGITQGAVSRMVRELEATLGVPLFRQAGRGVVLTEAGQRFAPRLSEDLARLRQTLRLAGAAGAGRALSVAVLPTFGSHWLAPRLPQFQARHPEITLALQSRTAPVDLVQEGVDLAIHFGREEWVDGVLTELCPEDLIVVAAPALVAAHGLGQPAALAQAPLLHLQTRLNAWPAFFDQHNLDANTARRGTLFDQFAALIAAATHALGAAIVPTYLVEAELSDGRLKTLGRPKPQADRYFVVTPKGIDNPAAEALRRWLIEEAQRSHAHRHTSATPPQPSQP